MFLLKSAESDGKTSTLIKKQDAGGLLSNSGLKTPLGEILLLSDTLF